MRRWLVTSLLVSASLACAAAPAPEQQPVPTSAARSNTASLTGNWAVDNSNADGATRKAYFNLTQTGDHISGSVRSTQFYYPTVDGVVGADGFTLTASMMDGKSARRVTYQGKLVGDTLHLFTRRRPGAATDGEHRASRAGGRGGNASARRAAGTARGARQRPGSYSPHGMEQLEQVREPSGRCGGARDG
jgi:hypothetical protein